MPSATGILLTKNPNREALHAFRTGKKKYLISHTFIFESMGSSRTVYYHYIITIIRVSN